MKIAVDLKKGTLKVNNETFTISCVVRNEINGWRKPDQVIRSIPYQKPVYPRPFPKGNWKIYAVEYTQDKEFAPVKIKTDAFQMLPVWTLDSNGNYKEETKEMTRDVAYWLHFSEWYKTTLGCIRLDSSKDAYAIAGIVEKELLISDYIDLEVA